MKKKLTSLLSVCLILVMLFAFAGCKVAGKTYVFDKIKGDVTAEEKEMVEAIYKEMEFTFDKDGKVKIAGVSLEYTQKGSKITIKGFNDLKDNEFEIKEKMGKLVFEMEEDGKKVSVYFKKK